MRIQAPPPSTYQPAGKAGQLMTDMRCFSCHTINGRGGSIAPDLTLEGSSVQRAWLVNFLKRPNTLRPTLIRRMPKFNVTDEEANVLADYIMTVYQTPAFDSSGVALGDPAQGKDLYYGKYACNSCHILDPAKDKGYIGPTLTAVGLRMNAAWIFHWLKNAQALRPGTPEINWNMSDEDARAITAFLMQQKSAPKGGARRNGISQFSGCWRRPDVTGLLLPVRPPRHLAWRLSTSAVKNRSPGRVPRSISRWWHR